MEEVKEDLKENFYLSVLNALKLKTNLNKIQNDLKISKQQLNYYLLQLKKSGSIIKKGRGWYEVIDSSKNPTKYGNNLPPDFVRGHSYVWDIKLPQEIKDWDKRIELLKNKGINYKLVGAKLDTPRIKVLGRKIWLCKDHLRIFESKDTSYYGENAIESKKKAFMGLLEVINGLEHKLGIIIKPFNFEVRKEHYALIKNDLAIDCNKKGVILRISDESGEWLLVDDSLEKGGELETIGKKALVTNIPMQKWWNDMKNTKFEVTPTFLMETMNGIQQNQLIFAQNMQSHIEAIQSLSKGVKRLTKVMKGVLEENRYLKLSNKNQKQLSSFKI